MSRGVNRVILVGNLGADPEQSGPAVKFRVATTESWKDKQSGERTERTEWTRITAFGRLAEICAEYLRKGSQVYVEGSLRTDKWTDNNGNDRYTTEVVISEMQMLGGRADGGQQQAPRQTGRGVDRSPPPARAPAHDDFGDSDIPF